jgi:hypothetical protein
MSYANQHAECIPTCALWQANVAGGGQCGLLSVSDRVTEGFDQLVSIIRDIKVKL